MQPGDTIFVPEKIVGAFTVWQNILGISADHVSGKLFR